MREVLEDMNLRFEEVLRYKFAMIILPSFGLSPFPVIVANED